MASGARNLEPGAPRPAPRSKPDPAASRKTDAMTIFGRPGINWMAVLRRRPTRIVAGHMDGGYTDVFEIICRNCGDDPGLDYSDASPELQQIRGSYQLVTGIAAYEQHLMQHSE